MCVVDHACADGVGPTSCYSELDESELEKASEDWIKLAVAE